MSVCGLATTYGTTDTAGASRSVNGTSTGVRTLLPASFLVLTFGALMGYIVYDGDVLDFTVDDRLLAHLQIVIVNKFRQNESFMFSWKEPMETGDGRSSVWLSPSIGLPFKFAGSPTVEINPTWLASLYSNAASGRGFSAAPEPVNDPATALPGTTGDHVDWANDRAVPPKTRAARPSTKSTPR